MSGDALHPQAITALLQEVRKEVKDGFQGLRDELRSIERAQVAERREIERRIDKEIRRLDERINGVQSAVDVSKGEAKVAGRIWGAASSIATGLILWMVTNL